MALAKTSPRSLSLEDAILAMRRVYAEHFARVRADEIRRARKRRTTTAG